MTTTRIGKYLRIREVPNKPGRKTRLWLVVSNDGALLGTVRWYGAWRQYVYEPVDGSVYNAACMDDLSAFLREALADHRSAKS